ncbi:hypothetical protein J6E39_09675 [bacterium]|nr:hypothetical protein [bacterium]
MNEIITFFSDIFCMNNSSTMKIGLSQFKDKKEKEPSVKIQKTVKSETKLSDLMRGA